MLHLALHFCQEIERMKIKELIPHIDLTPQESYEILATSPANNITTFAWMFS